MTVATTRTRHDSWTLILTRPSEDAPAAVVGALEGGLAASVPGSVLGTLIQAGYASDVTVDGREDEVAWAAASTWTYRTRIPRTADGADVALVLDGVDTCATVRVDGQQVLDTDDMFHAWRVPLGTDDSPGWWDVEVEFAPAEPIARSREQAHPLPRADMYDIPFNQVRKMACSFGWDWGPTTITAGLWREASIERTPIARIVDVRLAALWDDTAVLTGAVEVSGEAASVEISVHEGDSTLLTTRLKVADAQAGFRCDVSQARRWDVVGRGDQPLYDVVVVARDQDGLELDRMQRRVGFRTTAVIQRPDEDGTSFEIHINGSRVWARGFNWIPADVLPERVERRHVRRLISEAVATGATMLRVWGGGVIESDDFYDLCDEYGLMVWQDFSFACAAYAEDDAQVARVRREVADAVRRVGHRASLVLWCGCNENLWGYEDWGWKESLGPDEPWGEGLYYGVIPEVLHDLDPHRPYIPGSPFSPDRDAHPNDQHQGPTHHWDTWNELDYTVFEDKRSRFAAEFGWQAPPSWPTLVRGIAAEPEGAGDRALERIQKHPQGMAAMARGIADHVPHLPKDGIGWYHAAQLMQARAIRAAIGRFRSLHDTCSGALWWQLDDCWPSLSWAVLDVTGTRKLGWHAAAEVMAPRAVLGTAASTATGLTLVNDLPEPWETTVNVWVVDEAGTVLTSARHDVVIAGDDYLVVEPPAVQPGAVAVVVDADESRGVRWLVPDLSLANPTAHLQISSVSRATGAVELEFVATTLVRDLSVLAHTHPALEDAVVDGQLRLMLPGERHRVRIRATRALDLSDGDWAALVVAGTEVDVQVG